MSIEAMVWVFKHSEARLADRLVLLAIADEADDDGTNAYPSLRRIASKARVSLPTAHAAVARLEELGELWVDRPEKTGRGHVNRYEMPMRNVQESEPLNPPEAGEMFGNVRKRSAQACTNPQTPRPVDQEQPSVERPLDLAAVLVAIAPITQEQRRATAEEIFDFWRDATNHPKAALLPKRRRKIEWARKHYDDDDIADAIRGAAASPFHQGQNPNSTRYDDIELILRDEVHLERFRDSYRQGPVVQVGRGMGALVAMEAQGR